ncbi:unnamed protein product [Euphydryas editha]|uniref:Endonuclease-reverse transcriptase n=1 Tax=Euphydryas editha TaxID=104508 RepID=A0AAU9UVU7_EUPED|nr:unnamed protein product [Euphydryas editha]
MIQALANKSKEIGLEVNIEKTKVMTNTVEVDINLQGNTLEYVSEYVYLGQIISPKDLMSKEVSRRITNGWKKYWALKEIMKSKVLNTHIKTKTFNTCILPCLTYGAETWSLTSNHREQLVRCQRAMERSMLGFKLKDKIRNSAIRSRSKVVDILKRIDHLKWGWTGHMLRSPIEKWSKRITLWYPRDCARKQGRPIRRWEDEFRQTLGPYWMRVAADRGYWKQLEEAYARRHIETRDII